MEEKSDDTPIEQAIKHVRDEAKAIWRGDPDLGVDVNFEIGDSDFDNPWGLLIEFDNPLRLLLDFSMVFFDFDIYAKYGKYEQLFGTPGDFELNGIALKLLAVLEDKMNSFLATRNVGEEFAKTHGKILDRVRDAMNLQKAAQEGDLRSQLLSAAPEERLEIIMHMILRARGNSRGWQSSYEDCFWK